MIDPETPAFRGPDGVDIDALSAEIARRAASRAPVNSPTTTSPPFLGADADPLTRAAALLGRAGIDYEIGWRTPVLGQAWAAVREMIHGESRLYVDALMARQSEIDASLLNALARLTDQVAELRRDLDARLQDD